MHTKVLMCGPVLPVKVELDVAFSFPTYLFYTGFPVQFRVERYSKVLYYLMGCE